MLFPASVLEGRVRCRCCSWCGYRVGGSEALVGGTLGHGSLLVFFLRASASVVISSWVVDVAIGSSSWIALSSLEKNGKTECTSPMESLSRDECSLPEGAERAFRDVKALFVG